MTEPRKVPTIQDVARFAEVSSATVSRALTTPERVSEATRQRINEAVAATGYTVNQSARSLRMRNAKTILIATPNIGNPFYSMILDAVVQDAAARGYGVLVANRLEGDSTSRLKDYFYSNRADGLLLFDSRIDLCGFEDLPLHHGNRPIVLSCDDVPDVDIDMVMTDNRNAADTAVQHLIDLGHTRIGTVSGPNVPGMLNERQAGFERAMARAGLSIRPEWQLAGTYAIGSGVAAGEALLGLAERPTAMFCANDEMAIGLISALQRGGLNCPRDISIVGFDDVVFAPHLTPALTTMHQPRYAMGRLATKVLLDILDGTSNSHTPQLRILKSELIVRGSTAPPPH